MLEFDSTYGRLAAQVESADTIAINAKPIAALNVREPAAIGWGDQGADIVIESTGKFRSRDDAALHLKGGARKVLVAAPGKNADLTLVSG